MLEIGEKLNLKKGKNCCTNWNTLGKIASNFVVSIKSCIYMFVVSSLCGLEAGTGEKTEGVVRAWGEGDIIAMRI